MKSPDIPAEAQVAPTDTSPCFIAIIARQKLGAKTKYIIDDKDLCAECYYAEVEEE